MIRTQLAAVFFAVVAVLGVVALAPRAATAQDRRIEPVRVDRLTSLEQRIATLEKENAALRDVVKIGPNRTVTLDGTIVTIKGQAAVDVKSDAKLNMTSTGVMTVRGSLVTIN